MEGFPRFPAGNRPSVSPECPQEWPRLPPRTSKGNTPSMPQGFGPFLAGTLNAIYRDADSLRRAAKNAPRIWPTCSKFFTTLPHALRKAVAQECPQDSAMSPQRTLQDFPARLPQGSRPRVSPGFGQDNPRTCVYHPRFFSRSLVRLSLPSARLPQGLRKATAKICPKTCPRPPRFLVKTSPITLQGSRPRIPQELAQL